MHGGMVEEGDGNYFLTKFTGLHINYQPDKFITSEHQTLPLVWLCPFLLTTSKFRVTHRSLELRHVYKFKGKGELQGLSSSLLEDAKNRPLRTQ